MTNCPISGPGVSGSWTGICLHQVRMSIAEASQGVRERVISLVGTRDQVTDAIGAPALAGTIHVNARCIHVFHLN